MLKLLAATLSAHNDRSPVFKPPGRTKSDGQEVPLLALCLLYPHLALLEKTRAPFMLNWVERGYRTYSSLHTRTNNVHWDEGRGDWVMDDREEKRSFPLPIVRTIVGLIECAPASLTSLSRASIARGCFLDLSCLVTMIRAVSLTTAPHMKPELVVPIVSLLQRAPYAL